MIGHSKMIEFRFCFPIRKKYEINLEFGKFNNSEFLESNSNSPVFSQFHQKENVFTVQVSKA